MRCRTSSRRHFLKTLGWGAAATALTPRRAWSAARRRPNILFILVDDLGKEWVSCYGAEEIETPRIDALAASGVRFTNAYSMPQCTPTRVTLLTGQYPFRHGWVNHWDVPRWGAGCHFDWNENLSFARLLRDAGYATAAAGKWQINDFRVQPDAMERHGFDEYCMWTGYETGNPPSAERYWDPYIHTREGSRTYKGEFGPDVYSRFLIDFMSRRRNEPIFLYFPMALTHGPFVSTPDEPDAKGKLPRHKAMVRYTDKLVGRLVDAVKELGLLNDTIIIFTTDNGASGAVTGTLDGRKVRGGKASIGENGVCEPFIASCPGRIPEGRVTDALTDFTDLFPTFLDLAGVPVPPDCELDGHAIVDVLLGKTDDSPREWIMAMGAHPARLTDVGVEPAVPFANRAIRDKRYKLWVEDGKPSKLVDLEKDPREARNLLGDHSPAVAATREKLLAVLNSLPRKDARPRYSPTPPQPWDVKPPGPGGRKKKGKK